MAGVLYFDGGGCFCYQELGACVVREVAKLKMALNNAVIYDESRSAPSAVIGWATRNVGHERGTTPTLPRRA